uniref:Uncharacterized protein n=1 Tax=Arundo donax TaxID=35708 RepID=A0A0A8Z1Q7_ARUDO
MGQNLLGLSDGKGKCIRAVLSCWWTQAVLIILLVSNWLLTCLDGNNCLGLSK